MLAKTFEINLVGGHSYKAHILPGDHVLVADPRSGSWVCPSESPENALTYMSDVVESCKEVGEVELNQAAIDAAYLNSAVPHRWEYACDDCASFHTEPEDCGFAEVEAHWVDADGVEDGIENHVCRECLDATGHGPGWRARP